MKEHRDNPSKETSNDKENFLSLLKQEVQSDKYRRLKKIARKHPHPAGETLYNYVLGWLNEKDTGYVREHLVLCEVCADEVVRIMRIEGKLEQETVEREYQGIPTPGPSREGNDFLPSKEELPEVVATEYWEPQWAGQVATAADIPKQKHQFFLEDGDIQVECHWGGPYKKEPAYIQLSWKAHLITENTLYARFIDPETKQIRNEIYLGKTLVGEEIFTSDDLGFDPSTERWALSLILREPTE